MWHNILKRTVSLAIAVMLLVMAAPVFHVAGDELPAAEVRFMASFDDGSGTAISAVPASGTVRAICTASRDGEAIRDVRLLLAAYQDNHLVKVTFTNGQIGAADCGIDLSATLTGLAQDAAVTAYLWDTARMQPLSVPARLGSDDNRIRSVTIDGVPLETFSQQTEQYQLDTLPLSYVGWPHISARTQDPGARISIHYVDMPDGSLREELTVSSQSGKVKNTYTFDFPAVQGAVTNASIKTSAGNKPMTPEVADEPVFVHQPSTKTPSTAAEKEEYLPSNVSKRTKVYQDRESYFLELPGRLQGAQYLPSYFGSRADSVFSSVDTPDATSFTINKTATVYVLVQRETMTWLSDYTKENWTVKAMYTSATAFDSLQNFYVYSKQIPVADGATATVNIPGTGGTPALSFIAFETTRKLGSATVNLSSGSYHADARDHLAQPVFIKQPDAELSSELNPDYGIANIVNPFKPYYDRDIYLYQIPDEVLNGTLIQTSMGMRDDANVQDGANGEVLTLELYRPATVYVCMDGAQNMPWMEANGFEDMKPIFFPIVAQSNQAGMRDSRSFTAKKHVTIPEGERSVTVNIGGSGRRGAIFTVIVWD